MDKIIFLDIDGVLNVHSQVRDMFGHLFHKAFEDNLRTIIERTGAQIVISSTWRRKGLRWMRELWKQRGLAGEIIGITPTEVSLVRAGLFEFYDEVSRGHEIQKWIDDNNVSCYCIIDDDSDMLPSQKNNFVHTCNNTTHPDCVDWGYGLTKQCAEKAIEILNRTPQN